MTRITPDAFRHVEDEFLAFCWWNGWPASRKDVAREDEAYRTAIVQTRSWKRNEFDVYVVLPPGEMVFADQKACTEANSATGNAAIELRAIWAGLMCRPILSVFTRPPDWDWILPEEALKQRVGGCCDDCYATAVEGRWEEMPEKCPRKWWSSGSGDPWLKVPVSAFHPWIDLLAYVAWKGAA